MYLKIGWHSCLGSQGIFSWTRKMCRGPTWVKNLPWVLHWRGKKRKSRSRCESKGKTKGKRKGNEKTKERQEKGKEKRQSKIWYKEREESTEKE